MEIIPVVDILDGQVVHAVAGKRNEYQPFLASRFDFANAQELVEQFQGEFPSAPIYIADLNAIQGRGNNTALIRELLELGGHFLIDFGLKDIDDLNLIRDPLGPSPNWEPILATESVDDVVKFAKHLGMNPERFFFSIDIRSGRVVGHGLPELDRREEWVLKLIELGFRNLIWMDLDAVGTGIQQHSNDLLPELRVSEAKVYAAGGIKSYSDLARLENQGFSGALVATAIHNGKIRGRSK